MSKQKTTTAHQRTTTGTAPRKKTPQHFLLLALALLVLLLQLLDDGVCALQLLWDADTDGTAPSEDRVPDPPTKVRVDVLTPNSVSIRWDPPRNMDKVIVRGYTLSYGGDSTGARRVVLEGAETLEYALHGLKANTSYALSLTAYNEAPGEDSARVLLLVRTPPLLARDVPETDDGTDSLRPRGLRIERTRQTDEALLHWEEPLDEVGQRPLYYIINYASGAKPRDVRRLSVEQSPALLTDVKAEERYAVKVRAIFADGTQSGWSEKATLDGDPRGVESLRRWGGGGGSAGINLNGEEEIFCGFELPSVCDYIREGPWHWQRKNSTRDGLSMVLQEAFSSEGTISISSNVYNHFGRLMSPVYELRPSATFCLSAQIKVAKGAFGALFRLGVHFEGEQRPIWLFRKSLQRVWPQGEWTRLSFQLRRRPPGRGFQAVFDVSKSTETKNANAFLLLDNVSVRAANCPPELEPYFGAAPDEESEANLLIPLENLIDTDPRVHRTTGLDGLPAVGIKRGVEIVVPYRIYLPRKFYRNFAILASIRPADHLGGYLFAVLNAFDTVVELGVQLQPAGPTQTNISLLYTDSHAEHDSRALVSFLVPAFTGQWTQFALEVHEQSVGLYFRCMRFAIRQVHRLPSQLQMDDASKLYIANAGPILGGGFEWKTRRRDFSHHKDTERDGGAGGEGSGFGGPSFDNDDAGGGERSMPTTERPLMSTTSTTATYTTMAPPTTATTAAMATRAETRPSAADRWDGALSGPQGQKGEPGVPGTCASECRMPPPGPPGLPGAPGVSGLPGVFTGLSDADVRRIVKWPDVKGEKGTCMERHSDRGAGTDSMARHNQRREEGENENALELLMNGQSGDIAGLPPYDSRIHGDGQQQPRVGQKGDKGDRGVAGTAGAPGPPGPPGPVPRQQQQQQQQQMPQSPVAATVSVYQTALELLAGTPKCPIGTLAFAISTQQLFLRVHSGWRQVLLDPTILNDRQPPLTPPQQRQPLPPPAPQFRHRPATQSELLEQQQQQPTEDPALSRLAYWLALDEPSGAREDEESESAPAASRGRGPEGPEGAEGALVPIGRPPLLPPTAPPAPPRSIPQAQPWRTAQLPPKGWKSSREEETEKPSIRHKDKVIHLMALNEPLLGNFGGVRGADLECYRQARQAGFSTTFRAFISSRVQDLNKIVHAEDRQQTPVVNLLGERLFDSWHGVFDGGAHAHVPLYTFDRRNVFNHRDWSDRWVWHGSSSGGLRSLAYCADWRSTKLNTFGMASPLHSRHALTDQSREMPCNRRFAVLCVEVMSKHSVHQKLGKRFMSDLRV